ncbi:LptF/LptG family permease [bacterium]|nr:LptF/LptG family permease [bacterium]
MTILKKHFLKEFFKYFAILILSFTAIAVIAEFFDKAPEFYPADPPVILVVQYLLLQAPRVLMYALPFASLFSILITIGIASKAREITTIKASGCSTRKFFSYYLVIGVIMSLAALLLGETLVPAATKMATEIRKIKILKQSHIITLREQSLWLRGIDSSLIRIDGFVEGDNRILRTSIFSFDSSFNLEKRIEAQEGI